MPRAGEGMRDSPSPPLISSPLPWPDESFDEDDFDEDAYYTALGTRPPLNMEELDPSYQHAIELFSVCTSEEPAKRPSAAHIVTILEAGAQQP